VSILLALAGTSFLKVAELYIRVRARCTCGLILTVREALETPISLATASTTPHEFQRPFRFKSFTNLSLSSKPAVVGSPVQIA